MKTFKNIKASCMERVAHGKYCFSAQRTQGKMLCRAKSCPRMQTVDTCKQCGEEIIDSIGSSLGLCDPCWQKVCSVEFSAMCDTLTTLGYKDAPEEEPNTHRLEE